MWRASAWMAAFNASEQLGYMLTDHEFLVRSGGYVEVVAGLAEGAAVVVNGAFTLKSVLKSEELEAEE